MRMDNLGLLTQFLTQMPCQHIERLAFLKVAFYNSVTSEDILRSERHLLCDPPSSTVSVRSRATVICHHADGGLQPRREPAPATMTRPAKEGAERDAQATRPWSTDCHALLRPLLRSVPEAGREGCAPAPASVRSSALHPGPGDPATQEEGLRQ